MRNAEQFARIITDSTTEGIWAIDLEGRINFVNAAAAQLVGWEADDLVGRAEHYTFHGKRADATEYPLAECPIHGCLADGRVRRVNTDVFWRKDGSSFPVEFTAAPIREDEAVVGVVVTVTDVSDKRRLETQLLQAQKLEAIGMLAAGIAHEINTPTQYVTDNVYFLEDAFSGLAGVLRSAEEAVVRANRQATPAEVVAPLIRSLADADGEYLVNEVPRAIQQTLEGLGRVSDIVRSMKEFSHPGTGQKVDADLNRAIENTINVCRNEWRYVADVELALDKSLPPVPCFPAELNQAILNIVINAAHAIADGAEEKPPKRGTITISTNRDGDWAEIHVRDDGPGVPQDIRDQIFNPFFTTKEVGRGTGQGLAIARSVAVDKHGGTLDVYSEPGEGATFVIRLPLLRTTRPARLSRPMIVVSDA